VKKVGLETVGKLEEGIVEQRVNFSKKNKMKFKKRTPEEIDQYIRFIGEVWKRHPHLRLGQLISNVDFDHNIYNMWDEELKERLEKMYES